MCGDVDVVQPNTPDSVFVLGIDMGEVVDHCVGRWKLEDYRPVEESTTRYIQICLSTES